MNGYYEDKLNEGNKEDRTILCDDVSLYTYLPPRPHSAGVSTLSTETSREESCTMSKKRLRDSKELLSQQRCDEAGLAADTADDKYSRQALSIRSTF